MIIKYIIYYDSFDDKPIKSIYAIGGLNTNVPEATEIANYINGVEERRYAKQKILKELLKRHAEKFGYVLRRYYPQTGRFNHIGGNFTQNRADFIDKSNGTATFTEAGQIKFSERVTQTDATYLSAVKRHLRSRELHVRLAPPSILFLMNKEKRIKNSE